MQQFKSILKPGTERSDRISYNIYTKNWVCILFFSMVLFWRPCFWEYWTLSSFVLKSITWCQANKITGYIIGKTGINSAPGTELAVTKLGRLCTFRAMSVSFIRTTGCRINGFWAHVRGQQFTIWTCCVYSLQVARSVNPGSKRRIFLKT